jgi:TonB family protein
MEEQNRAAEAKDRAVKTPPAPDLHLYLLDEELAEDVVSSYRWREAVWLSLVTHGILIGLLLLLPRWIGHQPVLVPLKEKPQTTFLTLPDDQLKVKTPPKTDQLSDKNRIAQSRTPSQEMLRKLLDARRPGAPKPPSPPPGQQAMQQNPDTQAAPPVPQTQPAQPQTTAKLEAPAPTPPQKSPFAIASPGASVSGAIHAAASGHSGSRVEYGGGEYGNVVHPRTERREGMEILSDTMGVDFGSYMKRLHYTVQTHWDPLIPESALPPVMKKGVVVIEFSITKNGRVEGMKLIASSGDVALDRAAWGAITDAIPLPNLPVQFAGDYLTIRARFYYNPDKADLE